MSDPGTHFDRRYLLCSPTDALVELELGHRRDQNVVVRQRRRFVVPIRRPAGGGYRRWFDWLADVAENTLHRGASVRKAMRRISPPQTPCLDRTYFLGMLSQNAERHRQQQHDRREHNRTKDGKENICDGRTTASICGIVG